MADYKKIYEEQCNKALSDLRDWCGGTWSQVARVLGVHYQACQGWRVRGKIGARTAVAVDQRADIPFSKEQLRPDIKDWSLWADRG